MKRILLLAAGAIACFASACNGALSGDDSGEGSSKDAIGTGSKETTESGATEASTAGEKQKDGALDPCPESKPGEPGGPGKPGEGAGKPGTEKPVACFTVSADDVCADAADAKLAAAKLCASKGYEVTGISMSTKGCSVTCCTTNEPAPPPPPPVGACTWTAVGDGSTCIAYVDLELKAVAACGGDELQSIHTADDCANGATIAKVECCSAVPTKGGEPVIVKK